MRRRSHSHSSRDAASPERELRLEEQRNLSALNMKLENVVMAIRCREAELLEMVANGGTVSVEEHLTETSKIRNAHYDKKRGLLEQLNRAKVRLDDITRKLDRDVVGNAKLNDEKKRLEQICDDLQNRIAGIDGDRSAVESNHLRGEAFIAALRAELNDLKQKDGSILDELELVRERNRDLSTRVLHEQELRWAAQEDLKVTENNLERERQIVLRRMEELGEGSGKAESAIRHQVRAEMKQALADITEKMRSAHGDMLRKQREDSNRQIAEYQEQIAALVAEKEELHRKIEGASAPSFLDDKDRAAFERRFAMLSDEFETESSRHHQLVKTMNAEMVRLNSDISRVKAKLKSVEDERNYLLPFGVHLKQAVELYEDIVIAEEERLAKRQKVSHSPEEEQQSPVRIVTRTSPQAKPQPVPKSRKSNVINQAQGKETTT